MQTPESSKLRLWITRAFVYQAAFSKREDFREENLEICLADNIDLLGNFLWALKIIGRTGSPIHLGCEDDNSGPWDFKRCEYHERKDDVRCPYL
jgi:hypothetical protein